MRQYNGYFFDLDGTLIDTAADLNAALNHALSAFGLPGTEIAHSRMWVGHGARRMIEEALKAQRNTSAPVDSLFEAFLGYYAENIADHSQPYVTVCDTLNALRARGAKLAVVTNKREAYARKLLDALQMTAQFDLIVGGDTAAQPKPDAAPVLYTCDRLSLTPAEVLFVGDSTTDVHAARAAGCDVVVVPYGYNQGVDPEALGADGIIENFAVLVDHQSA